MTSSTDHPKSRARAIARADAGIAEERFRRVFEDSPTGMALSDLDLQIIDVNPAFAAFLGLEVADLVGRSVASFSHPGDMELNVRNHRALLAGETRHYTMEKRYRRADGTFVWAQLTVALIRDADGRPLFVHAQVEDISARRRATESLDRRARRWSRRWRMARSLGLTVVPEGIETEAQRDALLAIGCRYGQGFLFGRPVPGDALDSQPAAA